MPLFGLLGPLEIRRNDREPELATGRKCSLLLMLLLRANRPVPTGELVDALWRGDPPPSAASNLRVLVWRWRSELPPPPDGSDRIDTQRGSYRLHVARDEVDAWVFEDLAAAGLRELDEGEPSTAVGRLQAALDLWHGEPFEQLDGLAQAERARLAELRRRAGAGLVGALFELGRYAAAVPLLRGMTADRPFDEQAWERLMLALDRSGRRAEALGTYGQAAAVLREDLGIRPGARLEALQRRLLAADRRASAPARQAGLNFLPRDVANFTGRQEELRLLLGAADAPSTAVIAAVDGMAGVGKTALAVHAAHQLAADFPDGLLFVDLHGYSAGGRPVNPSAALDTLLRAVSVPYEQIPAEPDDRAARWRAELTGRRVLLILDNAIDTAQVRPLLPGRAGTVTIVTSRRPLAGLDDVVTLTLDVLPDDDAAALFGRGVATDRAEREPAAVRRTVELCGNLPLAIRLASARLRRRPSWTIDYLVQRLRDERSRLTELAADDRSVAAAFAMSYRQLTAEKQRMFRLLGLHPGLDVDAPAAAALADRPADMAERLLEELLDAHLLLQTTPGRYRFHDLVRRYAYETARCCDAAADRDRAVGRLLSYYLGAADGAATVVHPGHLRLPRPSVGVADTEPRFGNEADALNWLETERANLVAVIRHAARHGPASLAWHLAHAMRSFFWFRRYDADWLTAGTVALQAAEEAGDDQGQGAAHSVLAARWTRLDPSRAVESYTHALAAYRQAGWLPGEASTLNNLGTVNRYLGRSGPAVEYLSQALSTYAAAGSCRGETATLLSLGGVRLSRGELRQAEAALSTVLGRYHASRYAEAEVLLDLTWLYQLTGELDRGREHVTRALPFFEEAGIDEGRAKCLNRLACLDLDAGRYDRALDQAQRALSVAAGCGDTYAVAEARVTLGRLHERLADLVAAEADYAAALTACRSLHDRYTEIEALTGMSSVKRTSGDVRAAKANAERAVSLAREAEYRLLEGRALTALAAAHLDRHAPLAAMACAKRAQSLHAGSGHRIGEADALHVAGRANLALGDRPAAHTLWHQAIAIYTALDAPDTERIRAELAAMHAPPAAAGQRRPRPTAPAGGGFPSGS